MSSDERHGRTHDIIFKKGKNYQLFLQLIQAQNSNECQIRESDIDENDKKIFRGTYISKTQHSGQVKYSCNAIECEAKSVDKSNINKHIQVCSFVKADILRKLEKLQNMNTNMVIKQPQKMSQFYKVDTIEVLQQFCLCARDIKFQSNSFEIATKMIATYRNAILNNIKQKWIQVIELRKRTTNFQFKQNDQLLLYGATHKKIMQMQFYDCFQFYRDKLKKFHDELLQIKKGKTSMIKKYKRSFHFFNQFSQIDMLTLIKPTFQLIKQAKSTQRLHLHYYSEFQSQNQVYSTFPSMMLKNSKYVQQFKPFIDLNQIKLQVKKLFNDKKYQLACLLWLVTCMGMRKTQLLKLKFKYENKYVSALRILQSNQRNIIRFIPKSLIYLIQISQLTFPMKIRDLQLIRKYCLQKFQKFYSLRSTFMNAILTQIAKKNLANQIFQSKTTILQYYVDIQSKKMNDQLFHLDFLKQMTSINICQMTLDLNSDTITNIQDGYGNKQIAINPIQNQINDMLQIQNSQAQISQNQMNQIRQHNKLPDQSIMQRYTVTYCQQNFNTILDSQMYKSLKDVLKKIDQCLIDQIDNEQNLANICKILQKHVSNPIKILQFCVLDQQIKLSQANKSSDKQLIVIVKIEHWNIFKINADQFDGKLQSFKKRRSAFKVYKQDQQLILRPGIEKCIDCRHNWELQVKNKCNHLHWKCQCYSQPCIQMQIDEKNKLNVTSILIYPQSKKKINLELNLANFLTRPNNISKQVKNTKRIYEKFSLYYNFQAPFNTTMQAFSQKLNQNIIISNEKQQYMPLQIRKTKNIGLGVFATSKIPAKSIICLYSGDVYRSHYAKNNDSLFTLGIAYHGQKKYCILVDPNKRSNVGRFINSCQNQYKKQNCQSICGLISIKQRYFPVVLIYSTIDIQKGQEILYNYGIQFYKEGMQDI